jgi:hypothetical protein
MRSVLARVSHNTGVRCLRRYGRLRLMESRPIRSESKSTSDLAYPASAWWGYPMARSARDGIE